MERAVGSLQNEKSSGVNVHKIGARCAGGFILPYTHYFWLTDSERHSLGSSRVSLAVSFLFSRPRPMHVIQPEVLM